MPLVEESIQIDAPIELVYEVSQDYDVRYEWDPFPEKISVVSGSPQGLSVGTTVLVRSKLGMEMLVEFIQVAPPFRAAIKMIQGPSLIEKFAGSWIFEPNGEGSTFARFRYSISTRPAWLTLVGNAIATLYFSRTARRRLAGLKRYCESTECRRKFSASNQAPNRKQLK